MNKKIKTEIAIGIILVIAVVVGVVVWLSGKNIPNENVAQMQPKSSAPVVQQPVQSTSPASVAGQPTNNQISNNTTPSIPSSWKNYTNKQYGYELKYPADWFVDESKDQINNGTVTEIGQDVDPKSVPVFTYIVIRKVPATLTLADMKSEINTQGAPMQGATLTEITFAGRDAFKLELSPNQSEKFQDIYIPYSGQSLDVYAQISAMEPTEVSNVSNILSSFKFIR